MDLERRKLFKLGAASAIGALAGGAKEVRGDSPDTLPPMEPMNEWIKMQAEVRPFIAARQALFFNPAKGELRIRDTQGKLLTRQYDRTKIRDLLIYLREESVVFNSLSFDGTSERIVATDPEESQGKGMEIHIETDEGSDQPADPDHPRPIRL